MTPLRLGALLVLGVILLGAPRAWAGPATDRLKGFYAAANQVLEGPITYDNALEKLASIRRLVNDIGDWDTAAARALGPEWTGRTPEEQREFARLFSDLIERMFVGVMASRARVEGGVGINWLGERLDGEEVIVVTAVQGRGASEFNVEYRMARVGPDGGQWRIRDVVFDGVSVVENYRAQFQTVVRRSSYGNLVAEMRTRVAEAVAGQPVSRPATPGGIAPVDRPASIAAPPVQRPAGAVAAAPPGASMVSPATTPPISPLAQVASTVAPPAAAAPDATVPRETAPAVAPREAPPAAAAVPPRAPAPRSVFERAPMIFAPPLRPSADAQPAREPAAAVEPRATTPGAPDDLSEATRFALRWSAPRPPTSAAGAFPGAETPGARAEVAGPAEAAAGSRPADSVAWPADRENYVAVAPRPGGPSGASSEPGTAERPAVAEASSAAGYAPGVTSAADTSPAPRPEVAVRHLLTWRSAVAPSPAPVGGAGAASSPPAGSAAPAAGGPAGVRADKPAPVPSPSIKLSRVGDGSFGFSFALPKPDALAAATSGPAQAASRPAPGDATAADPPPETAAARDFGAQAVREASRPLPPVAAAPRSPPSPPGASAPKPRSPAVVAAVPRAAAETARPASTYWIQVGAFSTREAAAVFATRVKLPHSIVTAPATKDGLTRVMVGPYRQRADAAAALKVLRESDVSGIIREEPPSPAPARERPAPGRPPGP